jgi:hypothetical protein
MDRDRYMTTTVVGAMLLLLLVLAGVSIIVTAVHWDGSFAQAEFQITFRDADGNPLSGVVLCVEDEKGNQCFGYPVSDYARGNAPRSDESGVITFHHVSSVLEFGGRSMQLLWLIPIGDHGPPRYVCRFVSDNQEVLRTHFNDLYNECGTSHKNVVRKWDWASCRVVDQEASMKQDGASLGPETFDLDTNGAPLTMEENAVRNATIGIPDKIAELKRKTGDTHELLTFALRRAEILVEKSSSNGKNSNK